MSENMHDVSRWNAQLSLRYQRDLAPGRTRLSERSHFGPLRVLKTLYPEGAEVAHTVIVHPPAGIASADRLHVRCHVESGAHAVVATPGAQKWYRSATPHKIEGGEATTTLEVAADGILEWMPQESIVYDGCVGTQTLLLEMDAKARAFAWEMVQFGRAESGEPFAQGRFSQSLRVRIGGRLQFSEKMLITGGDLLFEHPTNGAPLTVFANAWVIGLKDIASALHDIRERCASTTVCFAGATVLEDSILLIKVAAHRAEDVRTLLVECRNLVRMKLCGCQSAPLRIWST